MMTSAKVSLTWLLIAATGSAVGLMAPRALRAGVLLSDNFDGRTTLSPAADAGFYSTNYAPPGTTGRGSVSGGTLVINDQAANLNITGGSVFISHMFSISETVPLAFPFGPDLTRWQFNMQISRPPLSSFTVSQSKPGFTGGLMLSAGSPLTSIIASNGVAVLVMADRLQLRNFTSGVATGSEITSVLLADIPTSGGAISATDWFSVDVSYNAHSGEWRMRARDDGAAAADPAVGASDWSASSSAISPRSMPGAYVGYYAQYSSGSMTMAFDNVTIGTGPIPSDPVPEPASLSLLAGGAAMLLRRRGR